MNIILESSAAVDLAGDPGFTWSDSMLARRSKTGGEVQLWRKVFGGWQGENPRGQGWCGGDLPWPVVPCVEDDATAGILLGRLGRQLFAVSCRPWLRTIEAINAYLDSIRGTIERNPFQAGILRELADRLDPERLGGHHD